MGRDRQPDPIADTNPGASGSLWLRRASVLAIERGSPAISMWRVLTGWIDSPKQPGPGDLNRDEPAMTY
jgi:hypothetical protein